MLFNMSADGLSSSASKEFSMAEGGAIIIPAKELCMALEEEPSGEDALAALPFSG